jgi:predicted metal-dependent RNase
METDFTEKKIKEIIPEEAEFNSSFIDHQRSIVVIEAKNLV